MSEKVDSYEVKVQIDVYRAKELFMRQEVATEELADGTHFTVDLNVNGDSLLVRFGKGNWHALSVKSLMDALIVERKNTEAKQ